MHQLLRSGWLAALFLCLFFAPASVASNSVAMTKKHLGMELVAVAVRDDAKFDTEILEQTEAVQKLSRALDRIYDQSPFNVSKIEALKRSGKVQIIYDPNFPDPAKLTASILAAVFLPQYADMSGREVDKKNFIVVVSRNGINWPLDELAAVLVHELAGHGTQHLFDRFENMRPVERECEAWMFEEQAYQDLQTDKHSRAMIDFRKQLEGSDGQNGHCTDFKRYVREFAPSLMQLWERLNPDVPKLLVVLEDYMAHLRRSGVTKSAASARKEEIFQDGTPDQQYQIAVNFLKGRMGVKQNPATAASWFYRAAQGGHKDAQYALGLMMARGTGANRNLAKAHLWLSLAGSKGHHQALVNKLKLEKHMSPQQLNEAKSLLKLWRQKHEAN
jgi:hypothetical protein